MKRGVLEKFGMIPVGADLGNRDDDALYTPTEPALGHLGDFGHLGPLGDLTTQVKYFELICIHTQPPPICVTLKISLCRILCKSREGVYLKGKSGVKATGSQNA